MQNPRMYYRAKELIRVIRNSLCSFWSVLILYGVIWICLCAQKAKEIENARKIHDPVKEKGNVGPIWSHWRITINQECWLDLTCFFHSCVAWCISYRNTLFRLRSHTICLVLAETITETVDSREKKADLSYSTAFKFVHTRTLQILILIYNILYVHPYPCWGRGRRRGKQKLNRFIREKNRGTNQGKRRVIK